MMPDLANIKLLTDLKDLAFFDHLPPSVYIFYCIKVYKNLGFFWPPSPLRVKTMKILSKVESK